MYIEDSNFPKVQRLLEEIGYRFDRDMTEAEGDLMFRDNQSGRWLRFDDCREALGWIDGYVMLEDDDNLLQIYEETMRSPALPDYPELLQKALKHIDDFCLREYDSHSDPDEYRDLAHIPVAFTTLESDFETPVQAYIDVIGFRIFTCLGADEIIVREEQYSSLQEMIELALPYLDFADLTAVDEEDLQKLNDTLAGAYERASNDNVANRPAVELEK